jgi:hypothetical protein
MLQTTKEAALTRLASLPCRIGTARPSKQSFLHTLCIRGVAAFTFQAVDRGASHAWRGFELDSYRALFLLRRHSQPGAEVFEGPVCRRVLVALISACTRTREEFGEVLVHVWQ